MAGRERSHDAPRYEPEVTEGWLGHVRELFLAERISEISDAELLAPLDRRERDLVRKLCGCGPKRLLRNWRVEYGVWLVAHRGLTVTQAAQRAGFHDAAHFAKACRDVTGRTPTDIAGDEAGGDPSVPPNK